MLDKHFKSSLSDPNTHSKLFIGCDSHPTAMRILVITDTGNDAIGIVRLTCQALSVVLWTSLFSCYAKLDDYYFYEESEIYHIVLPKEAQG